MNSFDIFVDSAANIPDELVKKHGIGVVSYSCTVNGNERLCYEKDVDFIQTAKKFYEDMRGGAEVKTSLIGAEKFIAAVTPSLQAGKDVIIVTCSAGISGTFNQAVEAQKQLAEQFKDNKVYVCDGANASMGEGLLALKVADLRDMGESAEACAEWFKDNAYKMNSYFTVGDLKYMRRGGRISATLALAGTILNIKPILTADGGNPAKIIFFSKERGRKKSLNALAEAYRENAIEPETQTVAITHADCEEDALYLAELIKQIGVKDIIIEYYDLCTGGHVGPGTVALFFFGHDRRPQAAAAQKKAARKPQTIKN